MKFQSSSVKSFRAALTMQGASEFNPPALKSALGHLKFVGRSNAVRAGRPYYRQERGQEVPLSLPVDFTDSSKRRIVNMFWICSQWHQDVVIVFDLVAYTCVYFLYLYTVV